MSAFINTVFTNKKYKSFQNVFLLYNQTHIIRLKANLQTAMINLQKNIIMTTFENSGTLLSN